MAKTLNERLASASVSDRINIQDLERLIADARCERDAQAALHVSQSADAVNFRLAADDRDLAAQNAERAARDAAMLDAAIADLETRLQARRETDKRASVEAERNAALMERDAVAERIRAEWTLIVEHIASLFEAIEANDARLAACGSKEISAEAVARGCSGNFYAGSSPIKRLIKMQVPELSGCNLAWPTTGPRFVLPTVNADVSKEAPKVFLLSSQHPSIVIPDVETADGIVAIGHSPTPHRLDREMVEAAKCKRLRIVPVADTQLAA